MFIIYLQRFAQLCVSPIYQTLGEQLVYVQYLVIAEGWNLFMFRILDLDLSDLSLCLNVYSYSYK